MDVDLWVRMRGCGYVGVVICVWLCVGGCVGVDVWLRMCGCGCVGVMAVHL